MSRSRVCFLHKMRSGSSRTSDTRLRRRGFRKRVLVVSGIGPGPSGTGRVVSHLQQHIRSAEPSARLVARSSSRSRLAKFASASFWLRLLSAALRRPDAVVILHPQTLGTRTSLWLLRRFAPESSLLALDSGFFCIKSYNHLPDQYTPCLACLGGNFREAAINNCLPFPGGWPGASRFVRELHSLGSDGSIRILVQSQAQATLARHHFGERARIVIVGLWANDFGSEQRPDLAGTFEALPVDVVFHGAVIEAKGVRWLIDVARQLPSISFLIPSSEKAVERQVGTIPANIRCRKMTWESGLRVAVASARLTVIPSLWSAPIEGALVKSLRDGNIVGAVDVPTGYASSIPSKVVAMLSPDPASAAQQIEHLLEERHDEQARSAWLVEFANGNQDFAGALLRAATHD